MRFAQRLCRDASLGFDFNLFGAVVEKADADVVKAEIFLDVADDVRHHLLGILARNRGLRNTIQEGQLTGAPLFLGKKPGVFYRNRNLPRRGLHHFQVALLEGVFALRVHRSHDSGRPAPSRMGAPQKDLAGRGGT